MEHRKLDAQTIATLERNGADLARPLDVDHFIESLDESSAQAVANELRARGFVVTLLPPQPQDDVHHWGVEATVRMIVDDETVACVRAELTALAERVGGVYDGWGVQVE